MGKNKGEKFFVLIESKREMTGKILEGLKVNSWWRFLLALGEVSSKDLIIFKFGMPGLL